MQDEARKEARQEVREKFDEIARRYDEQRRKLIPCFDDFYQIPVSVASVDTDAPNILDIGAGTGLFSSFMLQRYPRAKVTLIDLSENMLAIAKERFRRRSNVRYITGDYTKYKFGGTFDLVISSLSIHHLTDEEKRDLYRYVFSIMNENGIFLNADQVLGSTPYLENLYKTDWKRNVEASGLSREEILAAYERTKLDKMSTLEQQLAWLKDAGFADVDCIYKSFNFVVLFARKKEK
ncbi:class I SAM-dependent methyltransferase [Bacillaceae bacterium]